MKLILFFLLFFVSLFGVEGELTLQQTIDLAKKGSFAQKDIVFNIEKNDAQLRQLTHNYYPNIYLDTQLGKEQNLRNNKNVTMNDSFAYIVWKNNLYNWEDSLKKSNFEEIKQLQKLQLQESFQTRKIVAMQYFFDLKLAIKYHQYILEDLAMKAIKKNRLEDLQDGGRTSDITLLKSQSAMNLSSAKNYKAQQDIFMKKKKLTNFLGLDFYSIETFENPNLESYFKKAILEDNKLKKLAYKNDPVILKMQQKIKIVQNKIKNIDNTYHIKLTSTMMYGKEEQKTVQSNDNRYEARLSLQVPFYDGGVDANKIEILQIEKRRLQNRLTQYKQDLALKIDQLLVDMEYKKRLMEAKSTQLDYRDLYLEKARILYDQDRASDLGDSMTLLSKAEYEYAKAKYAYVIAFENLNLLTGVENEIK